MHLVLLHPPAGWTGSVGFVTEDIVRTYMYPPDCDTIVVLCGPPGMSRALRPVLERIGYTKDTYFSFM